VRNGGLLSANCHIFSDQCQFVLPKQLLAVCGTEFPGSDTSYSFVDLPDYTGCCHPFKSKFIFNFILFCKV
jgi:hypothetical protein